MVNLSFFNIVEEAWEGIRKNLPLSLALTFVFVILNIVFTRIPFAGMYLSQLFGTCISIGYLRCLVLISKSENFGFSDFFWVFQNLNRFLNCMIMVILYWFIVIFSFICLIIPVFFAFLFLSFHTQVFLFEKDDAVHAIKQSYHITKNHVWALSVFFAGILFFNFLGAISLLVGLLFTIPTSVLAMVIAYGRLKNTYSQPSLEAQVQTT